MKTKELTPSQLRFADEWLLDFNGGRAYKAAYPRVKKDATAMQAASRLLRNVKVRAYINAKQAEMAAKYKIDRERVLKEESCIAFSDITKIFKGSKILPPDKLPEETTKAVRLFEYKERRNGAKEYKYHFWDKGRSLERLSKHLGLYEPDSHRNNPSLDEIFLALKKVSPELAQAVLDELKMRVN